MQRSDVNEISNEFNVPESWKWENQAEVNERKERKGKRNRKKKNAQNKANHSENAE